MKQNNVKAVSDTLSEKPIFIRFGFLLFMVRPLTLGQIYEIGALVENVEELDLKGEFNPIVKMLQRYTDMKVCTEIVKKVVFRGAVKRFLFGWYISRHLTMERYRRIIDFAAVSFHAAFFLTSFTFLKGTKEVTGRTNTEEATALGDSSEA